MARSTGWFGETFGIGVPRAWLGGDTVPMVKRRPAARRNPMEALLLSTLVVAVAEIGDKTQILALLLGAHFKKPLPVLAGILVATLANHAAAAAFGTWLLVILEPEALRCGLGMSFLALAAWTLRPDKIGNVTTTMGRLGVFGISLTSFFLAEMGDKTQVATVALTASFDDAVAVVAGTTWGMMVANVPAVLLGSIAFERVPLRVIRVLAASLFVLMGVLILIGADLDFPPHNASSGR